jgi:hypothetical protein
MRAKDVDWGGKSPMKVANFQGAGNTYSVVNFMIDNQYMVNEECEDKEGELIHRTYFIKDALQWVCFLSDKEQVHGQAGTGEQAADQRVPRERDPAGSR